MGIGSNEELCGWINDLMAQCRIGLIFFWKADFFSCVIQMSQRFKPYYSILVVGYCLKDRWLLCIFFYLINIFHLLYIPTTVSPVFSPPIPPHLLPFSPPLFPYPPPPISSIPCPSTPHGLIFKVWTWICWWLIFCFQYTFSGDSLRGLSRGRDFSIHEMTQFPERSIDLFYSLLEMIRTFMVVWL